MQDKALISLACMGAGCGGVVSDIQGGYGLSSCLKSLGIIPGNRITRITPVPVQGPITIEQNIIRDIQIREGL